MTNVFSFARYGQDKMNICLAVGVKDANTIRCGFLRDNMDFLKHVLASVRPPVQPDRLNHARARILAWIVVNSDWTKHCLGPDDPRLPDMYTFVDMPQNAISPLILFNNPAVAIEFDLPHVVRYLIESVRIDMNSHSWSGWVSGPSKQHLLHLATLLRVTNYSMSYSCLLYLFRRLPPNGSFLRAMGDCRMLIWQAWFLSDQCRDHDFAFFLQQARFAPNRVYFIENVPSLPLFFAVRRVISAFRKNKVESMRLRICKLRKMLQLGADPWKTTANITVSPISDLSRSRQRIADLHPSEDRDRELMLCNRLIDLMQYNNRL